MRRTLCLIAALTLSAPAIAESPAAPAPQAAAEAPEAALGALMEALHQTYKDVTAVQATFTQSTSSPAFGDGPAQQGTLTISRPRMMRVEITGDNPSQFISDGETLWVYSPANSQVIITPDLSEQSDGLSDLIESLSALQERFEVTGLPAEPGQHAVSLAPRDGATAQFKELRLGLDAELRLTSLELVDAFDGVTRMDFQDFDLAPAVAPGTFSFEAPEGTTVIRSDQM